MRLKYLFLNINSVITICNDQLVVSNSLVLFFFFHFFIKGRETFSFNCFKGFLFTNIVNSYSNFTQIECIWNDAGCGMSSVSSGEPGHSMWLVIFSTTNVICIAARHTSITSLKHFFFSFYTIFFPCFLIFCIIKFMK